MVAEATATAEGSLERTPFSHLIVYGVDRRLTGALFLTTPGGTEHIVQLARGAPIKVRPGDGFSLLGEMLIEAGAIPRKTLEDALATKGLLGDVLLLAGCVDRDVLESIASLQFLRRMVRLFELPPETTYRYFEGSPELIEYGGEPSSLYPLALLWAGLRDHAEVSSRMEATLSTLGETPLRLHAASTVGRFGLNDPERQVVDWLGKSATTLPELIEMGHLPEAALRRLVYALAITRQLDLGAGTAPVGTESGSWSTGTTATLRSASSVAATLGRVALRATAQRAGAAAPDPPGEGDHAPTGRRRKERLSGVPSSAPAPALPEGAAEPASARIAKKAESPELCQDTLPPDALFDLASELFASRDLAAAAEACDSACRAAPDQPDYGALSAWIRAALPGADLKSLSMELDDLVRRHEEHVPARFYRGLLRKRLGDDGSAARDLRRVLEIDPKHEGALRELGVLEAPSPASSAPGFLRRLFRR